MFFFDNNEGFRLAFEQAPIGMCIVGADCKFVRVNKAYCELVGYSERELLGLTFLDITHKDDVEKDMKGATDVFAGELDHYSLEKRYIKKDGSIVWINLVVTKLDTHPHGGPFGFGMAENITQRRHEEEARRRMAILELREDFVSMLNHDLKNPLLGANRILELILEGKIGELTDRQHELLNQLLENNKEVVETVHRLIDVYRYGEYFPQRTQRIDFKSIVLGCLGMFAQEARKRSIKLIEDVPEQSITITADREGLKDVISNLIENALKFTPAGGTVKVSLKVENTAVTLRVQDDGYGIELDRQQGLFTRFWKGGPEGRYSPGTGIGLFSCKQIVDAHKGLITCESEPGQGSTFTVSLPIQLPDAIIGG